MYRNILVPVDLSHAEVGTKILRIARAVGGPEAQVMALYVAPDIPNFVDSELPQGLIEKNIAKARDELAAMAKDAGAKSDVAHGHTSTRILERAEQIGADLIVIGSHQPGLQDYFIGSTAARVVRHAHCAVLVDR